MATKKKVNKKIEKKPVKKVAKAIVKKPVKKVVKKVVKNAAKNLTKKLIKKTSKSVVKSKVNAKSKTTPKKVVKKSISKAPVKTAKAISTATKSPKLKVDYSKAITPLGDRLVVRVVNSERVTPGGLIIPDSASSIATGYLKASVLAVGHGGKTKKGNLQPLDVKVGDTVLFSEYSGTKVTFNSEELQIIHESDVMGIVQN